jgi:outer membrane protein OmpA-like peptidoglycan-associated protein
MAHSTSRVLALVCALSTTLAFADGALNDAYTTSRLGGVGNYLFRGASQEPSARQIEDTAANFVEIISFSQSAPESIDSEDAIVITFKPRSSKLPASAATALDDVAKELNTSDTLKADIAGYADGGEPSDSGDLLSSARARAVMEGLRQRGVPGSKIFWSGRGGVQSASRRAEINVR